VGEGRYYEGGAYRDTADGKYVYNGFLSPLVLREFARYMHKHRLQSDGHMREADNWKKGLKVQDTFESFMRHVWDIWLEFDGEPSRDGMFEALGGALFNLQALWLELLRDNRAARQSEAVPRIFLEEES
jgi:hypothetical protein